MLYLVNIDNRRNKFILIDYLFVLHQIPFFLTCGAVVTAIKPQVIVQDKDIEKLCLINAKRKRTGLSIHLKSGKI